MSKFSGASSVRAAQAGQLANLTLPTGDQQAAAPTPQEEAPSPQPSGLMQELQAYQPEVTPEQELQAEVDVGAAIDTTVPEYAAEVERQAIPSLAERGAGEPRVDRWLRPPTPVKSAASQAADGNIRSRAKSMSDAISSGTLNLGATTLGTPAHADYKAGLRGPELADKIREHKEGDVYAAIARAQGMEYNQQLGREVPSPLYTQIASAVVENEMANAFAGDKEAEADPLAQATQDPTAAITAGPQGPSQPVTHAQGNAQIGKQINLEYQRMQGNKSPENNLSHQEAETLGAAFKHMWAEQNPDLVTRTVDPKTQQYVYQLTPRGEQVMEKGKADRARLFPTVRIKPSKQPLPTGQLPGDVGANVARKASGAVGKPEFGKTIQNAMKNLAQVPNVVDKQRTKLLYATILPALAGDTNTWMADINNIGPTKWQQFNAQQQGQMKRKEQAEKAGVEFDEEPYSPEENMAALVDKVAQEVRAIAQERNGANYLSYNVQGFQGRITPQQSFFNPTTSKAVRFVTRNAVPSIAKPGSRVEKNLRQMYAMMILPKNLKADVDLPVVREQKLTANSDKLEAWGDRLTEALNNSMTDAEYDAVSQAIEQGLPITDPNFPQVKPLGLDPQADAELIAHITSKGEDGPHVMDGLIDFAKYMKAKRQGRPHNSFFNAYMDGKTNGLASNGIQMGHAETAERTGVIRKNRRELLDDGDIRDILKDKVIDSIQDGWDGDTEGFASELDDVAEQVYGHRDLNKMTTMTFGYGKEIESFTGNIEDTIALLSEKKDEGDSYHESLKILDDKMSRAELAETLMNKYEGALREVMSEEALAARALMRSAAALHSATNQLFSIKSPTGMDINLGRELSTGYDKATKSTYRIYGEGQDTKTTVAHYETEATSAAARTMSAGKNKPGIEVAGEYAYGGSVVAPVQAMDAATVALSASGKSWDRLSRASGGNPYMHTIYDAFKVDANGYDVVLEEVNKNWLNTGMNWSYLQATYDSTKDAMTKFQKELANRNPNEALSDNEKLYMDWMLKPSETKSGKLMPKNYIKKMSKFKEYGSKDDVFNDMKDMVAAMKKVGYNVYDPPQQPTVKQLNAFVQTLAKQLNLRSRMESTINRTNANKKKLKERILKEGYKTESGERIALQYYAH